MLGPGSPQAAAMQPRPLASGHRHIASQEASCSPPGPCLRGSKAGLGRGCWGGGASRVTWPLMAPCQLVARGWLSGQRGQSEKAQLSRRAWQLSARWRCRLRARGTPRLAALTCLGVGSTKALKGSQLWPPARWPLPQRERGQAWHSCLGCCQPSSR